MLRKAGDIFADFNDEVREGRLSANRSEPIGAGSYGVVYQSDVPGNVIKQSTYYGDGLEEEANLQAIAADMGLAPQVRGLELFTGHVGDRIEMADARTNYRPVDTDNLGMPNDPTTKIQIAQQLGQLALKGINLGDRHGRNIFQHKMTGRPLQIDFGSADKMSDDQQAMNLALFTADGFEAAGIGEMGDILRATVADYIEGGQVKEAMDVAKQGFSRLQKIKGPIQEPETNYVDRRMQELNRILAEREARKL